MLDKSKKAITDQLWKRGLLSFLLDDSQKELYTLFYNSPHKIHTWLLARRSGKSFALVVLAAEQCIRHPNSIVKYVAPTKSQVNTYLRPLFKEVFESCPEEIRPEWRGKDYIYYFSNGSEIQLAGTENQHAERLRGGNAHIAFVDEARDCSDLDNIIKSILLPTTLITKGKVVIASTPPKESEHDLLTYIEEAELRGSLVKRTIEDNPRLTKEQIEDALIDIGGRDSEAARREYFCEILPSAATSVIPEFDVAAQKDIIKEWPKPPFYDSYVGMDLGGSDLTVALFGYFDFRADKVIIEDEIVMNFSVSGNNIETLTKQIQEKEKLLWSNPLTNEIKKPLTRVSDINYIVTQEIAKYSNNEIFFNIAKKDDAASALQNLKILIQARKIVINPRCKTLISHLKNVKWMSKNNKTKFGRSVDHGHYDAIDAVKYLIRHVIYNKNPYPANYSMNMKDLYVVNPDKFVSNVGHQADVLKKLFGIRKR